MSRQKSIQDFRRQLLEIIDKNRKILSAEELALLKKLANELHSVEQQHHPLSRRGYLKSVDIFMKALLEYLLSTDWTDLF